MKKRISFVTTNLSWGGSEELWSRTALHLAKEGLSVGASIGFSSSHKRILDLVKNDVDVHVRRTRQPFWMRAGRKIAAISKPLIDFEIQKVLNFRPPDLVVISDGLGLLRSIDVLQVCTTNKLPFVVISQLNGELFWPNDETASLYRKLLPEARRCYFVSKANQHLFEKQIGTVLPNAEVVCNPFNVGIDASPTWRPLARNDELRLANVARLEPLMKGQDLLLEALSGPSWRDRNWHLTFYGDGPMRNCIERMVQHLKLQNRVSFAGHVESVEKIWAENHVLVMPSRYEGLPLAMVEAMLCGRPIVATDVAGHSEIIEHGVTGFLAKAPTASCVQYALEQLWSRRIDLESIGRAGAKSIRRYVPRDPIYAFAEKIIALA